MRTTRLSLVSRVFCLLSLFVAAFAHAETKTYVGANGGSWLGVNQWEPTGNPEPGDDVIIDGKEVRARDTRIDVKSIVVRNAGGKLIAGAGASSVVPGTYVTVADDLIVTNGATLYVYAASFSDRNVFSNQTVATAALYTNATVVAVGGRLSVEDGSAVYAENDPVTGAAVFFRVGDFNVAAGGKVDAVSKGWDLQSYSTSDLVTLPVGLKARWYPSSWYCTYAFGPGADYGWGAGYGGTPLMQKNISEPDKTTASSHTPSPDVPWTSKWRTGETYGSAYAPFLSGSPGGKWGSGNNRGSGTIAVFATNAVTIAGTVDASGKHNSAYVNIPGASGGSIWICGKTVDLKETSQLLAKGGETKGYSNPTGCGGGGGRISVGVGLTQAEIDTLAGCLEPAAVDFFIETLTSPGVVSVIGGPDKDGDDFGNPGTATRVRSMVGKARMQVKGAPVEALSEGVAYGMTLVDCSGTLVYTSDAYGRDPSDPEGLVRPCLGWVASNATAEVARSTDATKYRAELTGLDYTEGPFSLTWLWGEASAGRAINIDRPLGGTVTARGLAHTSSFSLPAGVADEVTAAAKAGYRFLGWTGLPGGFSANATVTVPADAGLLVTALFEPVDGVYRTKTWLGGTDKKWETAANWDPAGVPTLQDDVVINSANCKVGFSAIAHSITVGSGKVLQLFTTSTEADKAESSRRVGQKLVADNTDTRTHRHLFLSGDLTSAGTVLIGGSGAVFTNLDVHVGGDLTLNGAAKMAVYPTALDLAIASTPTNLYRAASFVTVGGSLTLNDTSVLYPWCEPYTGTSVRFDVGNDLSIAAGASVNAQGLGFFWRPYAEELADPLHTYTYTR